MAETHPTAPASRLAFWAGVWGGAVAWFAHLASAYGLAEFGCVAGWDRFRLFGLNAVSWAILTATLVTLVAAALSAWLSWQSYRAPARAAPEEQEATRSLSRIGLILNALFIFAILFESVPIFFFLTDC